MKKPLDAPPLEKVRALVKRYLERFETIGWNRFTSFKWSAIESESLTEAQLDALKTAMLVEDHIPDYSRSYQEMLAIQDGLPPGELAFRREMLHFVFRWVGDEDRHAHTLENYLRACGRVDADALSLEMLATLSKPYTRPHPGPMQMAVHTVIQEKATQVFYACLRDAVEEPVLKEILALLSQDEARHCGFFVDLLKLYLETPGGADYREIKEAVVEFKMPLHGIIDNYKRRSIAMMRAAPGYNYREAFSLIQLALGRYADARVESRSHTLEDLLATLTAIDKGGRPPARIYGTMAG
ncbi:MAG TPA: acyl-ACP desaturase [Elusimicrobiota bacterium]|nr:acyl-ACP desaturase [Elusimicrobiota bacterium]